MVQADLCGEKGPVLSDTFHITALSHPSPRGFMEIGLDLFLVRFPLGLGHEVRDGTFEKLFSAIVSEDLCCGLVRLADLSVPVRYDHPFGGLFEEVPVEG